MNESNNSGVDAIQEAQENQEDFGIIPKAHKLSLMDATNLFKPYVGCNFDLAQFYRVPQLQKNQTFKSILEYLEAWNQKMRVNVKIVNARLEEAICKYIYTRLQKIVLLPLKEAEACLTEMDEKLDLGYKKKKSPSFDIRLPRANSVTLQNKTIKRNQSIGSIWKNILEANKIACQENQMRRPAFSCVSNSTWQDFDYKKRIDEHRLIMEMRDIEATKTSYKKSKYRSVFERTKYNRIQPLGLQKERCPLKIVKLEERVGDLKSDSCFRNIGGLGLFSIPVKKCKKKPNSKKNGPEL